MLLAGIPMSDISAALGYRDPNIVSVYLSTDARSLAACTFLFLLYKEVSLITSDSLAELIERFISYKKSNGYQYQTGAII